MTPEPSSPFLPARPFGTAGFNVTALGLGCGQVGRGDLPEDDAARLLHGALDLGVTFLDTARMYGLSEERIGRHLAGRRDEFILSSKCGYGIEGHEDWTAGCVTAGIDEALRRLRTDRIDVMFLHSCDLETLRRGEVTEALVAAVAAGKVGVAAYSGENEPLAAAVADGRFGSFQTSVSVCEQRGLRANASGGGFAGGGVAAAAARGAAVVAKRPLANGPWLHADVPTGQYVEAYWHRMRAMDHDGELSRLVSESGLAPDEFYLRFSAFAPGVTTAIAGTANLANLKRNAEAVARGPLPADVTAALGELFDRHDNGWTGQV